MANIRFLANFRLLTLPHIIITNLRIFNCVIKFTDIGNNNKTFSLDKNIHKIETKYT